MKNADLNAVMVVNRRCFPHPWSAWAIRADLQHNAHSWWVVLTQDTNHHPESQLARWLRWMNPQVATIIGFGSFWMHAGEMHISNIGIEPQWRGQGLGELLLNIMLRRGIELGGRFFSLEVRVSNTSAISLYQKYAYQIKGRKPHYYEYNNEDAYEMATHLVDAQYIQMLNRHSASLKQHLTWRDNLTQGLMHT